MPVHSKNQSISPGANNNNNNNTSSAPSPSLVTDAVAGLTFAQTSPTPVAGNDAVTHPHVLCFSCQLMGHYADKCPTPNGVQMIQADDPGPMVAE
jgi:hypothetical protein